jgi:hypothetical protein
MKAERFIESELLEAIDKNIVIFIDEVDSILSLNFQDQDLRNWHSAIAFL